MCKKCNSAKLPSEFEVAPGGTPRRVCRSCRNESRREVEREKHRGGPGSGRPGLNALGEDIGPSALGRTCLACQEWKYRDEYWVNPKGLLHTYCRPCQSQTARDNNARRWKDEAYRQKTLESNRRSKRGVKEAVISAYGGACTCCGEDTFEFLTLDHVNNDGAEHRRSKNLKTGHQTWVWAKKNGFPNLLQLLCWNCNSAKGAYGYCPHVNRVLNNKSYSRLQG